MIGGAADLVESTKTVFEGAGEFSRVHAGRNVPFGIREHAMGAIVNGAAAHGGIVKPYGSTFLIFSDYMRASVRLSALMGLPVLWVWTHDSVGVGEDGPTHQPIEHYASLRAIPAPVGDPPGRRQRDDGRVARGARTRPTAPSRCCSRARTSQRSTARRSPAPTAWSAAATCCGTPAADGAPELILISTGAEVADDARRGAHARRGGHARARRLDAVHGAVRSAVRGVPRARCCRAPVRARLAVEPGASMSWWKWVGQRRRRARTRSLRRLRAGYYRAREARLHRREHRRPRAGAARARSH